jgi:hypothetical protein
MVTTKKVLVREVPETLWERAKAKGRRDGFTMQSVIVKLLRRYVDGSIQLAAEE